MAHDWEPLSAYCLKCGVSANDFVNGLRPYCDEVGNVRGVSHLIAAKAMKKVLTNESSEKDRPRTG